MEIVVGALAVSTVCVVAGFVAFRGAGAAAQVMTQMFDSPSKLGWPSGVQEDDDFTWSWSSRPADLGETDIVDLRDGSGPRAMPVARH